MSNKGPDGEIVGEFNTEWRPTWTPCQKCGDLSAHKRRTWNKLPGGFFQFFHRCSICHHYWWTDGDKD